jgi:protein involved in polysaccharide export with SLBB domain
MRPCFHRRNDVVVKSSAWCFCDLRRKSGFRHKLSVISACLVVVVLVAAAGNGQSPAEGRPNPGSNFIARANLYSSIEALDDIQKLSLGDRVSYRVIEDREESKSLVVSDTGELEIPYLGRIKVIDKTCKGLAREIKSNLEKELYYQATVIVAVDQLNKKRGSVYLVGQVRVSGAQDIPSDELFTVGKAILKAGGFSDFADKRKVRVTRKTGPAETANKVMTVDVAEIFEKGKIEKDIKLEAGDLIFVPQRLINF